MSNAPVMSVTNELVVELEALAASNHCLVPVCPCVMRALLSERAEMLRVIADVKWRVADTTDQLQTTGFNGDRLYGLDEWSVPIKNLNMAVGILEKALGKQQ